jgi:hypothetical protein
MFGAPAVEERGWHRTTAALRRLPELLKRVRRLERERATWGEGETPARHTPPDSQPEE